MRQVPRPFVEEEAENFFSDGSQMVCEGREQARHYRKDNPGATIVVQDAPNLGNFVVYEPAHNRRGRDV